MNVLLWIVQAVLALQAVAGGAFKILKYEDIENMPATAALPRAGWAAVGALEIVCGVLLIVPMAIGWMPMLTPLAAVVLVVESLALAAAYARYSTKLVAANPLTYVVASAVMAAIVAVGRYALP
jgi:uncharacterized membrane protein YphA (DoxX/SURF4 family)